MSVLRFPLLLLSLLLAVSPLQGQLGEWGFRTPVRIYEEAGANLGAYPVLLFVNTQSRIQNGQMEADGRDLRFADSCGIEIFPHYIESGLNTDSTRIWVRISGLAPNDSLDFYCFHGNSQANSSSNLNAVFPNAFQSQGNFTLSTPQQLDWFELQAGDTLFLGGNTKALIQARNIILDGVVMGDGRGAAAPSGLAMSGNGMGAGGTAANAGSGGGGYGGEGGSGGYDFADTPGAGGASYGTAGGTDLEIGSSGASSPFLMGGAGGGAIDLRAEAIRIGGNVHCDGFAAQQASANLGAGGGSGGGIQLIGKYLEVYGDLSVQGGDGSQGFSASNDDGGGGGGGRIKLRYGKWLLATGNHLFAGGMGGSNGSLAPGQDGADGSFMDSLVAFPTVGHWVGSPQVLAFPMSPVLEPDPAIICPNQSVQFQLPSGYSQYEFFLNNVSEQSGTDSLWVVDSLSTGDVIESLAVFGACNFRDTLPVQVAPRPQLSIAASDSAPCIGDTVFLDVGNQWDLVAWDTGDSTAVIGVTFSGFYDVLVVDANGCQADTTYTVNLGTKPFPNISAVGLPACEGEVVFLSTGNFPSYLWQNGDTSQNIAVANSGTYTVTVAAANGCTNTDTFILTLDTLPTPDIFRNGNQLSTQLGYVSYQWLYNNSNLMGGNGPTFTASFNGPYSVLVEGQNGCFGRSDTSLVIVGVEREEFAREWMGYPNPVAGDAVRVRGRLDAAALVRMELLDVSGSVILWREVELPAGDFEYRLALGSIARGPYVLRLRGSNWERHLPLRITD